MRIEIPLSIAFCATSTGTLPSGEYMYTAKKPVEYQHGKQSYTLSLSKGEKFSIQVLKDGSANVVHEDAPKLKFKITADELKDLAKKCSTTETKETSTKTSLKKYEQCCNPTLYKQAVDESSMITYMRYVFDEANRLIFNGDLRRPDFKLLSVRVSSFLGEWDVVSRKLRIAPDLFGKDEETCINTLIHEMCHQAVSEIDHDIREQHGEKWKGWMRKAGLPENTKGHIDYGHGYEKSEFKLFEPVMIPLKVKGRVQLIKGIFATQTKEQNTNRTFGVFVYKQGNDFEIVDNVFVNDVYRVPNDEIKDYKTAEWNKKVNDVRNKTSEEGEKTELKLFEPVAIKLKVKGKAQLVKGIFVAKVKLPMLSFTTGVFVYKQGDDFVVDNNALISDVYKVPDAEIKGYKTAEWNKKVKEAYANYQAIINTRFSV